MRRLALVSAAVLLGATACGSARTLRSAVPLHNVVAYVGSDGAIRVSHLDGSHAKKLGSGALPALSPDGRFIAFQRGRTVLVMPAAGGVAEQVYAYSGKGRLFEVRWAPDSRHLALEGLKRLFIVDPISRVRHVLPWGDYSHDHDRFSPDYYHDHFSFSPDSRRIVYAVKGDLYVIPTRGGTPVRLTNDHRSSAPVWGKLGIAFRRSSHRGSPTIWLRDGRTHQIRQLTHHGMDAAPWAFSADGTKLLAAHRPDPYTWDFFFGRLWAVDVASGVARPITPWVRGLLPQGLSADGRTVLAVVDCEDDPGTVETFPFTGEKPHVIVDSSWKPHVIVHSSCAASWNAG